METCQRPPEGWSCTRPAGHDGPCAAVPPEPAGVLRKAIADWSDQPQCDKLGSHEIDDLADALSPLFIPVADHLEALGEAEDKAKDGPWKSEWFELESRAAVAEKKLAEIREALEKVPTHTHPEVDGEFVYRDEMLARVDDRPHGGPKCEWCSYGTVDDGMSTLRDCDHCKAEEER